MTDQLVLGRMNSRGYTLEDLGFRENEIMTLTKIDKINEQIDEKVSNTVQTRLIDAVLFISLILSGTLFFGAMDEYEVDEQIVFMKSNYGIKFSIIDAMRWSIVTATTVGYGDFYPQTTGGRVFGTFFIIFGVSLLARLLSFVLDAVGKDFKERGKLRRTFRKSLSWDQMSTDLMMMVKYQL